MDPLTALIGGGLSAGASLLGGFMNTSSQQAINAANLQQQWNIASGAQLSGLVHNAKAAGLNPLAVLGQSAPGGMAAVGTSPGAGVSAAGSSLGAAIAGIKDPHQVAMEKAQERQAETDIQLRNAQTTQTMIDGAIRQHALNQLIRNPSLLPAGVQERESDTAFGIPQFHYIGHLNQELGGFFKKRFDDELGSFSPFKGLPAGWDFSK